MIILKLILVEWVGFHTIIIFVDGKLFKFCVRIDKCLPWNPEARILEIKH
jgi:hypothetical protein